MNSNRSTRRYAWYGALALLAIMRAAHADIITDWNTVAMDVTGATPSFVQGRMLAIAHGAMYDAANTVEPSYEPYLRKFAAPAGTSIEAAVASAGHDTLAALVPAQKAVLDAALAASLNKVADGNAKDAGVTLGREVAAAYLAARSQDGMAAKAQHVPATGPGQWEPTPPMMAPMAAPQLGQVTPFTTKSFGFLEVKGPPALESIAFKRDLEEVRRLGGRQSSERTADQTASAIFWIINTGVPWNAAARAAAQRPGTSIVANARLFALMNMAAEDAYFASWQIKRTTNFWRPITAVRATSDAKFETLNITPAHPDYPSGHAIYSGAASGVLQRLLGTDELPFSATFAGGNGVVRSWTRLSEAESDVQGARVWAGIHFRSAVEDGGRLGHAIAEHAIATVMRPLAR